MRRMGWFVVGVATVAGAAAAVPIVRKRLRASDDGFEPLDTGAEAEVFTVEDMEVEADVVEARPRKPRQPQTDQQADELREKITESRTRLRQKAKAGTASPAAEKADEGDGGEEPEAS